MRGIFGNSPSRKKMSSSGSNAGASTISIETPPADTQQSQSRGRKFTFMRGSVQRSDSSVRRTREHARQIAQQLSTPEENEERLYNNSASHSPFPATTPTSSNNGRNSGMGMVQKKSLKPPSTAETSGRRKANALNAFMENQAKSSGSGFTGSTSVASETSTVSAVARRRLQRMKRQNQQPQQTDWPAPVGEKTVHSMPTFPSNSSMQADFTNVQQTPTSGQSVVSNTSAAARRRIRKQLRGTPQAEAPERNSAHSELGEESGMPISPSPLFTPPPKTYRTSTTPRSAISATPATPSFASTPGSEFGTPFDEQSQSQASFHGGFTFDAFGLDADEVDSEVNAALQGLAETHPDLHNFLGNPSGGAFATSSSGSPAGSTNGSVMSRSGSVMSRSTPTADPPDDTFGIGFQSAFPAHVRNSPHSSERSSLTSSTGTDKEGRVNMFKQKAGFHTSDKKSLSQHQERSDLSRSNRGHDDGWESFDQINVSPQYAKSEPGGALFDPRWTQNVITPNIPEMPSLRSDPPAQNSDRASDASGQDFDQSSWAGDSDGELSPEGKGPIPRHEQIEKSSDVGPPSSVGAPSDFGGSDVAVNSDMGVAPKMGIVPGEISGGKRGKASQMAISTGRDSNNHDEDDSSDDGFGEPVISPSKYIENVEDQWGQGLRGQSPSPKPEIRKQLDSRPEKKPVTSGRIGASGSSLIGSDTGKKDNGRIRTWSNSSYEEPGKITSQRHGANDNSSRIPPKTKFEPPKSRVHSSSASEIGGTRGLNRNPEMQSALNRMRRDPQSSSPQDTKSDVGGSTDLFNPFGPIKLKHTATIETSTSSQLSVEDEPEPVVEIDHHPENDLPPKPTKPLSYRERRELEMKRQRKEAQRMKEQQNANEEKESTPKMTYRERRELELRKQQEKEQSENGYIDEEKSDKDKERDVAKLIRQRIASNRRKAVDNTVSMANAEVKDDVTYMRSKLKKVSIEDTVPAPKRSESPVEFSPRNLKPVVHMEKVEPKANFESPVYKVDQSNEHRDMRRSGNISIEQATNDSVDLSSESLEGILQSEGKVRDTMSAVSKYDSQVRDNSPWKSENNAETPKSKPMDRQDIKRVNVEEKKERKKEKQDMPEENEEKSKNETKSMLSAFLGNKLGMTPPPKERSVDKPEAEPAPKEEITPEPVEETKQLSLQQLMAQRAAPPPVHVEAPETEEKPQLSLQQMMARKVASVVKKPASKPKQSPVEDSPSTEDNTPVAGGGVALKDDPNYSKYFRMLKVGMPMDVVKHAMTRDGIDADIMDGDHNKPAGGVPLKEDPKYEKYFKMLKMGLPMGAVKNAMTRDGLDPAIMDGDHNAPVSGGGNAKKVEKKTKDTHRRTRLHWETLRKVRANSLWAKINEDKELDDICIDEEEFTNLFQAELTPSQFGKGGSDGATTSSPSRKKRGPSVQVIDPKRANNGGIVLARLKISQDDMADAVDKIDETLMTAEQVQGIVEYLPSDEEKKKLEAHMLEGGMDAATKFDMLCECEKFMVAMMTVKHAKRKIRALLFKLQFETCLEGLAKDAATVEEACDQLSNSVRLRKLLGIVLNIGNRLNTAGNSSKSKAGAFTLESLLKLSHAKAFDKKTTFLQYMVLIVRRNNEILLNFKDDLPTVLKADKVFWDQCLNDLEEVENQLENVRRMALHQARIINRHKLRKRNKKKDAHDEDSLSEVEMSLEEEVDALRATRLGQFTLVAIKRVSTLREKVELTNRKFARLQEYFGVDEKRAEMQTHELFNIIVQFCKDFDKAREHVEAEAKKQMREDRKLQQKNGNSSSNTLKKSNKNNKSSKMLKASSFQPHMSPQMQAPPSPSTKSEPGFVRKASNMFVPRKASSKKIASPNGTQHRPGPPNTLKGPTLDHHEGSVMSATQPSTTAPPSPGRPPLTANKTPSKPLSPRSSIRQRRRNARKTQLAK